MYLWLPWWLSSKESACQCRRCKRQGFDLWVGKITSRRKWQPIPVFLLKNSHGQRSMEAYSPQGRQRVKRDLVTKPPQCVSLLPYPYFILPLSAWAITILFSMSVSFLIIITTLPATLERQDESPHHHMRRLGLAGTVCPEDPQQGSGGETVPLALSLCHASFWFLLLGLRAAPGSRRMRVSIPGLPPNHSPLNGWALVAHSPSGPRLSHL